MRDWVSRSTENRWEIIFFRCFCRCCRGWCPTVSNISMMQIIDLCVSLFFPILSAFMLTLYSSMCCTLCPHQRKWNRSRQSSWPFSHFQYTYMYVLSVITMLRSSFLFATVLSTWKQWNRLLTIVFSLVCSLLLFDWHYYCLEDLRNFVCECVGSVLQNAYDACRCVALIRIWQPLAVTDHDCYSQTVHLEFQIIIKAHKMFVSVHTSHSTHVHAFSFSFFLFQTRPNRWINK